MMRLLARAAVCALCIAPTAKSQFAVAYDFALHENLGGRVDSSAGRLTVSGNNLRMDMHGRSSFSRMGSTDLGDSVSIISSDTGNAQTMSVLGHARMEYVQFQPVVLAARARERMANAPGVSHLDFRGSSVTVDSLGPGPDIAGYKTLHFRIKVALRLAIRGRSLGNQDITADYFVAPDLPEFSYTGQILDGITAEVGLVPGLSKKLIADMDAATARTRVGLSLRMAVESRSNLFGTGVARSHTFDASNVQPVSAPASLFVVPADYKQVIPRGMEAVM